jgi:hypothetical protein
LRQKIGSRTTPLTAVVVLAFIATWIVLMSVKLSSDATDVPRYYDYGRAIRHGLIPYRDIQVEYPPVALPTFALPALVASGYRGYRIVFEALMAACGAGVIVAVSLTLARVRQLVTAPIVFVGAGTIALGPIVLGHYDLWPALLVSAALAALVWDRTLTAAILIGVAIAAKIYAVVLVPLAIVWIWRRFGRRRAAICLTAIVSAVLACFLPFVVASPGGVWWSLSDQANRPLQIESSAAAAILAAHQLISLQIGIDFSHRSVNLGGTGPALAGTLSVAAEILALLFVWISFARNRQDRRTLLRSATAAVLVFVLLGKVFSPQFLIWLIPLVAVVGGTLALGSSCALGAAILLTRAYFPGRWRNLIKLEALPTWLLVARDAVLLGILAAIVVPMVAAALKRRKPAAPLRDPLPGRPLGD